VGELSLKQYEESDAPYRLPDNMDIFTWSVPFLAEKVMNMLGHLVKKLGEADDDGGDPDGKDGHCKEDTRKGAKDLMLA